MSLHESVATLTQLSDRDLWTSALSTNGERRRATALLLAHLAVIEARELHLLRGYSSMFDFCVRGLGMSEGTAHDAPAGARPRVEPLSEERFGVHFTASARLRDKLEYARNLMSHVSRELEVVIERALDALIRELENKQWGKTDRPRRTRGTQDGSPTRKDKREVNERDDAQCAYVSEDGVRCTSKAFLQYDHMEPRALGCGGKADESRLLCQRAQLASRKTDPRPGARGASDRLAPAKVGAGRAGRCGAEAGKAPRRARGPGLQEGREQAGRGQRGARRDLLVHGRAAPPCVRVARSRMISVPPSTSRSKAHPRRCEESQFFVVGAPRNQTGERPGGYGTAFNGRRSGAVWFWRCRQIGPR